MSSPFDRPFDRITRLLARHTTRRTVVKAGVASAATGALVPASLHAEEPSTAAATPAASPITDDATGTASFLFVQAASGGTFVRNPAATPRAGGDGPAYVLTLEGHTGGTIYFSDRPERIVGQAPTDRVIAGLGFSPSNPPNAAIVTQTDAGDDVLVVELLNPAYDAAHGTLTYGANVLGAYTGDGLAFQAARQGDASLPQTLGAVSLFIDDCPDLSDCIVTGGPVYSAKVIGPIPDGPYGQCWHWKDLDCKPCDGHDDSYFADLCNQSYSECNNECGAG
ncbi:MAG: hypothetical protein ACTHQE_11750 [Thermomicrobiales bacterium]